MRMITGTISAGTRTCVNVNATAVLILRAVKVESAVVLNVLADATTMIRKNALLASILILATNTQFVQIAVSRDIIR